MKCPNCGTEIAETAKFCRKCGNRIEAAEAGEKPEEQLVGSIFEEPADSGDGSVEFDWDQPVELEEPERDKKTYEWGPPTGDDGAGRDDTIMPVAISGRDTALEEFEEFDDYGYGGNGAIPPWDHSHEFDPEDISDNKVMAMAAYLLGPIGIIIALLAAQSSPYAGFHLRQALKFVILEALTSIVMLLLCWTLIVPAAAAVFLMILMVLEIVAFVSVCKGRAVEPPILRSLKFMK